MLDAGATPVLLVTPDIPAAPIDVGFTDVGPGAANPILVPTQDTLPGGVLGPLDSQPLAGGFSPGPDSTLAPDANESVETNVAEGKPEEPARFPWATIVVLALVVGTAYLALRGR